jgi:N-methylhydantoinase A
MVAGGGAAGLNIVRIGRQIGLRDIVIPKLAAGLSAVGGLFTDITAVFSRGHHSISTTFDYDGVNRALAELNAEMDAFFTAVPHDGETRRRIECEARYDQQMSEIDIDLGDIERFTDASDVAWLQQRFDANHLDLFAVNQPGFPIETITWRAEARIVRRKPSLSDEGFADREARPATPSSTRMAYFAGAPVNTPIFRGERLRPGDLVEGPAIIEEPTTTIVVIPGARALVRPTHYLIDVGGGVG